MGERRLVITGAGGFVGRHIVGAALAAGFEVFALARRAAPEGVAGGASWRVVDLLAEEQKAAELIETLRPTHFIHAAWCTEHGAYWTSDENLRWLATTARLAHTFVRSGGHRFVMVGSCAEYAWSHDVINEERTPTVPGTLYGACKLAAHQALQAIGRSHPDFTAATGRLFFAYGPHEDRSRFVPYICTSLAAGDPASLSSGTQVRDFLHIEDVARAFVALLETKVTGAVNVGSGEPITLADIALQIGKVSGHGALVRLGARPDRPDDGIVLVADVGRLRALGWTAERSLEQGLTDTYAWWNERLK